MIVAFALGSNIVFPNKLPNGYVRPFDYTTYSRARAALYTVRQLSVILIGINSYISRK